MTYIFPAYTNEQLGMFPTKVKGTFETAANATMATTDRRCFVLQQVVVCPTLGVGSCLLF